MPVPRVELERRMNRFAETCRQVGMKVTHQRVEVLREVAASDQHPDAETVYQHVRRRVTGISRDTVYRTLATLEEAGLIRKAAIAGGPTRYDADLDPHHHFVCTACGTIKDFRSAALDDLPIPDAVKALGSIESTQVHVRGVCAACKGRKAKNR